MAISRRGFLGTTGSLSIASFIPFKSLFAKTPATRKSQCRTGLASIDAYLERSNIEKVLVIASNHKQLETFLKNLKENSQEGTYVITLVNKPSLEDIKDIITLESDKTDFIVAVSPVYSNLLYFSGDLTISITESGKIIGCEDEQPDFSVVDVTSENGIFEEISK